MTNKILIGIIIIMSGILVVVSSSYQTTFFNSEPHKKIVVKNTKNDMINEMPLEDYIIGVVAAEMPASFEVEALKAQAIASRTYALYKMASNDKDYDVVTDVSNQSFITLEEMKNKWGSDYNKYYDKIKMVVESTKDLVMTYEGEIIEAYYFAMSNGYTEDVSLVFSESKNYLQSVESAYDNESLKNFSVTTKFTSEEICAKLNLNCRNVEFTNIVRSDTNRVNSLDVNGQTFKGTTFRSKLGLRSTDFDIKIDGDIYITTRGYGHGVGMSQYGANGMAKNGSNYENILKYFYKNIEITYI